MPVTILDPKTALVVIDLQSGTLANRMAHPIEDVVARGGRLADAFRRRGLPVVVARSTGTPAGRTAHSAGGRAWPADFAEPAPSLAPQPNDLDITRATWGVFAGSNLHTSLAMLDVTQVVLVGVATSFGVESTAREAYDLGYHVAVAMDAVTDLSHEGHERAITHVFPVLGQTATTADLLSLLDGS